MKTFIIKVFILQILIFSSLYNYNKLYGIDLNFRHYKVENGLSSNTVFDIIQDSDGYIWVGTENGLNRFDAYEFINYRNIPRDSTSLINNNVYILFEDEYKDLWIGTQTGVSIYNLQQKQFQQFDLKASDGSQISERIQNIFADEKGQVWINAGKQGVFVYNKQHNKLERYNFDEYQKNSTEPVFVGCVYKDKDNTIWASVNYSKQQVYKLDKAIDKFVPAFPDTNTEALQKLASYAILEDTFGTLWFGTWTNGLYAVDKKTGILANYLNTDELDKILHIHSITEYEPGHLLIGSNDGLTSFSISSIKGNKKEMHLAEPTLSNRFVYPIYKDREGGLWIGTYYGGINYSSPNRNYLAAYTHDKYENSISGNVVSVFCEDKSGNLWIGTDDGGLNYFNTKTEHFTAYKPDNSKNSLSFNNIHALCIDDDQLWVGTYTGGLNILNLTTKKFKHYYSKLNDTTSIYANSIYTIFKDSRNTMWVGTVSGINCYNRKTDNFKRVKELDLFITDIEEHNNTIWFATNGGGLYTYNLNTQEWKHFQFDPNNKSSLISNEIICLCIDDKNKLWIGTNSGLCQFDSDNESFIEIEADFYSNAIYNIFSDNGKLWLATAKGLVYYNPKTGSFRSFTTEDGLLSEQFTLNSGIKTNSGRIYIGTANGFNAFYPKQITENRHVPQIAITDFQLFNKSVNINDYISSNKNNLSELTLPHNKNAFSFEYTALSYFAPEKNEYAFFLEGFDKDWNYVNKARKATYTNIPPGEYSFRVKASNNDGIWNDDGQTIKIIITSPFWWTRWSITLYIMFLIALLIIIANYLEKLNEKKNIRKIEKVKAEQEKEAYNSKINFFTTIAHEIRTPVSLIIGPLEQITSNCNLLPEDIVGDLKIIDRNSQRLLSLVNQILDFRKIEKETFHISLSNQNVHEFLLNIYARFKSFIEHKNIKFIYTYDSEDFYTGIDVENLTKVISNLLNNASKYTSNYIELNLCTNTSGNTFEIHVIDNGPGIPKNEQENIFKPFYQISGSHKSGTGIGLYLVKSIVDACEGEVKLESDIGTGLKFTIILPVNSIKNEIAIESNINVIDEQDAYIEKNIETSPDNKPTLLIVEDNIDMQMFLHKTFINTYNVLLADNGIEGIKILEKHETDIIISDIMMPEMDGIEFCNRVKNSLLWSHIPFVLLTAKTNIASKIEGLEMGADAYIEKPFSVSHLMAQIKNLIESRKNLLKKFTETPFATLKSIAGNNADEDFLARLNEIIEKNISNVDFNIEQLAEELCISSSGLFAKIKNLTNITPNKLLLLMRLKKAAELLNEKRYRVNEVSYMVGFNNPSYFAKCFQKQYGVLPKDFRETKKGE